MIPVDLKDTDKGKYDITSIAEEWSLKSNEIHDRINDTKMLKSPYLGALFFCRNSMHTHKLFHRTAPKKLLSSIYFKDYHRRTLLWSSCGSLHCNPYIPHAELYVYFQYGINCIQNSSWWQLSPSRKLLTPNTFLNFAQKINLVSNFQSVNKLDSDHSQEFLREIFLSYKCFCINLSYLCFVINLVSVVGKYEKMIKENFGLRQIRLASGAGEDWIHGSSFRCTVFIYVRRPVIWHVAATLNCLAQVCQAC